MSSHIINMSILLFTEQLDFSSETELNSVSQFSVSPTEGRIFHDAKELFGSAYALSKHSKYQFRHLMLCLKVANNATNNYQSCQSLYNFVYLSQCKTPKEPKQVLNNKIDLTNKALHLKKGKICLDCKLHLNLEIVDHKSSSKKCPVYYKNWRFPSWERWKKYLFENYSDVDNQNSLYLTIKIRMTDKECIKRDINDLLIFYSENKNQ